MAESNKDPTEKDKDCEHGSTDESSDSEKEDKTRIEKPPCTPSVKGKDTKKGFEVKAKSKKFVQNEMLKVVKQVRPSYTSLVKRQDNIKISAGKSRPKTCVERAKRRWRTKGLRVRKPPEEQSEEVESDSENDADDEYEYDATLTPRTRSLQSEVMALTLPYSPTTRLRIRRLLGYMDRGYLQKIVGLSRGQAALTPNQCEFFLKMYRAKRTRILSRCRMRRTIRGYWERKRKEKEKEAEEESQPGCSNWESPGRGRKRRSPPDDDSPEEKNAKRKLF
ncbi:hypothetical protein TKK_0003153 [Trichogramma kaykai]